MKNNIVKIHGRDYVTVARRVLMAHDDAEKLSIKTEVLPIPDQIVVKATVTTEKGEFTGISAANPAKLIEKQSPYEVAETSAVGRALGFAGYGLVESIASADEMVKAANGNGKSKNAENPECTCGTKGKYHAFNCPARQIPAVVQHS